MYYLFKSPLIYTYGQSSSRRYCSTITGAPGDTDWENMKIHLEAVIVWPWEMYLEATIKQGWKCDWRPQSRGFEDPLGGRDQVTQRYTWRPRSSNSEMHLEAEINLNSDMHWEIMIKRDRRCIWRPRWSSSGIHFEAEIQLNSEMNLDAVIERVWRFISRPRSCNSEMHMESMIERIWRCTWGPRSCNSEMHLKGVIEQVWRCTWRPRSYN